MTDQRLPEYFVDSVTTVTIANNVVRLTLAQANEKQQVEPVARLLIPANQLSPILQGIQNAAVTIVERAKASQEEAAASANAEEGAGAPN
ncbi:MAG: hypothetical protein AAF495_26285 [Pseudomonadota bacterium]